MVLVQHFRHFSLRIAINMANVRCVMNRNDLVGQCFLYRIDNIYKMPWKPTKIS